MDSPLRSMLQGVSDKFVAYLPNLAVGLFLIALGWLFGWVARRFVMRLCVLLRVDRWLVGLRWGRAFALGDVRHALYAMLGSIAFAMVFLAFLSTAVTAMQLSSIATLLERGVAIVPRMVIASIIGGLGWFAASVAKEAVARSLNKNGVLHADFISQFARAMLLVFFGAMALSELDIAREIVVIGFTVMIITLGALAVVLTLRGTRAPPGDPPPESRKPD